MAPLLTRAWDNHRSGWNQNETTLTQANVKAKGIARITTIPVYGDARGIEAQPLILPAVTMADGSTHDVMILPSMANIVRGVDATTGATLWTTPQLGTPITGSDSLGPNGYGAMCPGANQTIDCYQINQYWGILSTGVIDPDTQLVYLVAWISPDTTPQNGKHYMFVLNIKDGTKAIPPVLIDGANGTQKWSAYMRKQRSSLVMTNVNGVKTIFFASGTIQELGTGAAGWVLAYDVATNQITAALPTTQGYGGGIWMGGQGLAADSQGYLYGVTGNGSFDGVNDFAESILKIQHTPPAGATPASLKIVSWFTPYSDVARSPGGYPGPTSPAATKPAGVSAPSEAIRPVNAAMAPSMKHARVVKAKNAQGQTVHLVYPRIATPGAWWDEDLGSAQGALLENYGLYIVSGKDGIAYPTKIANLGNTMPADLNNAQANCAKLASAPVWLTNYPGDPNPGPCPSDPTQLNFFPEGKTRHMHMTPVQYTSPTRGQILFAWGENSQLHAWSVSPSGALTYLAQGNEFASANVTNGQGGMPGGFCSMSSNGSTPGTALLVCTIPYGDANTTVTNGRLLIYDPDNWVTNPDGTLTIPVLWDSQQWAIQFVYNKFNPPIVDGGQIYVPNYNGGVDVYGLTP